LVRITWLDACHIGGDGWHGPDDLKPPLLRAESAGYLVFEGKNEYDEECLMLASALVFNTEGKPECCPSFVIPLGMVVKREYL
jgi:hypothetical protein